MEFKENVNHPMPKGRGLVKDKLVDKGVNG
jgi:hypothetical protein